MERIVSVREIARHIQRPGETLQVATDRVRNWSKEGLLPVEGAKNPGRGRARIYTEEALLKAGLLNIITDVGIPTSRLVPTLHLIMSVIVDQWHRSLNVEKLRKQSSLRKRSPPNPLLLVLEKSVGESDVIANLVPSNDIPSLFVSSHRDLCVLIDLDMLFKRLKTPLE